MSALGISLGSDSILLKKNGFRSDFVEDSVIGVRLDVRNVSYSVFSNGKDKKLLRNISFRLDPGEMCALMGSSGAGKRFLFYFVLNLLPIFFLY